MGLTCGGCIKIKAPYSPYIFGSSRMQTRNAIRRSLRMIHRKRLQGTKEKEKGMVDDEKRESSYLS